MIEGLLDLIKEQVRPADMPMFFWEHLVHDIHMLSTAIGKSRDDSCLLMHLILKNIASQNTASYLCIATAGFMLLLFPAIAPGLDSREHRAEWERCFLDTY